MASIKPGTGHPDLTGQQATQRRKQPRRPRPQPAVPSHKPSGPLGGQQRGRRQTTTKPGPHPLGPPSSTATDPGGGGRCCEGSYPGKYQTPLRVDILSQRISKNCHRVRQVVQQGLASEKQNATRRTPAAQRTERRQRRYGSRSWLCQLRILLQDDRTGPTGPVRTLGLSANALRRWPLFRIASGHQSRFEDRQRPC